jgi:hypothetical protein
LEERQSDLDRINAENNALKAELVKRSPYQDFCLDRLHELPNPGVTHLNQLLEERSQLVNQNEQLQHELAKVSDEVIRTRVSINLNIAEKHKTASICCCG